MGAGRLIAERILAAGLLATALAVAGCQTVRDIGFVQATNAYDAGDYKKAAELFAFVAKAGGNDREAAARFQLARMYLEGKGVEKSPRKAVDLFTQVSTSSDTAWRKLALYRLGEFSREGLGGAVEKDRVRAARYFYQCAELNDESCKKCLARLTRHPDVFVDLYPQVFSAETADKAPAGMAFALELFAAGEHRKAFPIFLWHAQNSNARGQLAMAIYDKNGLIGKPDSDLYKG